MDMEGIPPAGIDASLLFAGFCTESMHIYLYIYIYIKYYIYVDGLLLCELT